MATEEKRADPRAPFVLRVNFRDRSDCMDATENLSRGGLFVQTSESFRIGQVVHLSVGFPGLLEPVALKGEVVWVRPGREGAGGGGGRGAAFRARGIGGGSTTCSADGQGG